MRVLRGQRYSRTSGRGCQRIVARGGRTRSVLKERGPGLWPRAPLFCLAGLGAARRAALAAKRRRPPACPPLPSCAPIQSPYGWRRRAGEGEGGDVGSRRGAAALCGPRGPAKPKHGRGKRSPPMLCARCARPPPPRAAGIFHRPNGPSTNPFRFGFLQTKRARRSR